MHSLTELLHSQVDISQIYADKCSYDIAMVWEVPEKLGGKHQGALSTLRAQLAKKIKRRYGKSFDEYLALGKRTKSSLDKASSLIVRNWGCEPKKILPPEQYGKDSLSVKNMSMLEAISSELSLEQGRSLLQEAIQSRVLGGVQPNGKRSIVHYLTFGDVKKVLTKVSNKEHLRESLLPKRPFPERPLLESPLPVIRKPVKSVTKSSNKRKRKRSRSGTGNSPGVSEPPRASDPPAAAQNQEAELEDQQSQVSIFEDDSNDSTMIDQDSSMLSSGSEMMLQPEDQYTQVSTIKDGSLDLIMKDPDSNILALSRSKMMLQPEDQHTQISIIKDGSLDLMMKDQDSNMLASLESSMMLQSGAIYKVLVACAPAECHVVDPLFVQHQVTVKTVPKIKRTIDDHKTIIIVPLHHRDPLHWTVIIYQKAKVFVEHFDSCRDSKRFTDQDYFHRHMEEIDQTYQPKNIVAAECPQQRNGFDCGIHVIANVLHYVTGINPPSDHNGMVWRRLCRAILTCNLVESTGVQTDWPTPSALTLDGDAEKMYSQIHDIHTKLMSEQTKNAVEVEEAASIGQVLDSLSQSMIELQSEIKKIKEVKVLIQRQIQIAEEIASLKLRYTRIDVDSPNEDLKRLESSLTKLARRNQSLPESIEGLKAARETLESIQLVNTQRGAEIVQQQEKWKKEVVDWDAKSTEEAEKVAKKAEWARRGSAIWKRDNL